MKAFNRAILFTMMAGAGLLALWGSLAWAHRGEPSILQESHTETPGSHLPGYFDSYVAPKGKAVVDLPTLNIDLGVTDHLTLGTNALPWIAMPLTGVPVFNGKARYQFYSVEKVASSITVYGGGLWVSSTGSKQGLSANYLAATSNTSYFFNRYTVLNFHLSAIRLGLSSPSGERLENNLTGFLLMPGLGFQKYLSERFGFEMQVLVPAMVNFVGDTTSLSAELSPNLISTLIPHRLLVNFKTGENAILSLGMMGVFNASEVTELGFPSLSFTWLTD